MTDNLIDKLERADGPDRELDQLIAVWHRSQISGKRVLGVANCAAYTASIDAAMTLVPEGWQLIKIEWFNVNDSWRAFMRDWHIQSDTFAAKTGDGQAATPALALCIAALRARSQGGE